MMNNKNKSEVDLMDEYYGESKNSDIRESKEYLEFSSRMDRASEELDVLNEDVFDFEIDTLGIIQRAEEIKDTRKARRELGIFIGAGAGILGGYGLLALNLGSGFIVITQAILVSILPWVIIPASILRKRREG